MEIKLLNQGSYGCIFNPGINCENNKLTKKYITKVQKQKEISKKETKIGKEIQKIVQYEKYFAPIIETCKLNLKKINNKEIRKCNFIDTNKLDSYESNQILFVGNKTLFTYVLDIIHKKDFLKKILKMYIIIIEGQKKLHEKDIIHLDIKENNIVITDKGNPKIIDFGLSHILTDIKSQQYKEIFFIYAPEYSPWCIEIAVINYIIHKLNDEWMDKEITVDILEKIVNEYIKNNISIKELFTEKEKKIIKENYINYLKSKITTGEKMIKELMMTYRTWDTYSINITFLHLFDLILIDNSDIMEKIEHYLKSEIMSAPNERSKPKNVISLIQEISNKITIQENTNLNKLFSQVNTKELSKKIQKTKIIESKIEEPLYKIILF